jgi:hypothetical protein
VEPRGRLELTWANKHLRLISDRQGGYEWVDPSDPRVTEVRLLHQVDTFGELEEEVDNLLIEGDALHALMALNRIPELAERYAGKIRLVYIDPPSNAGQGHYLFATETAIKQAGGTWTGLKNFPEWGATRAPRLVPHIWRTCRGCRRREQLCDIAWRRILGPGGGAAT